MILIDELALFHAVPRAEARRISCYSKVWWRPKTSLWDYAAIQMDVSK